MAGEPSTLTDPYGAVLSTTLRNMRKRIADNVTRGNKVWSWLDSKDRVRKEDGGFNVMVPLMYGLNSTADIYSSYGQLDTTPQDGITAAFYDWSQLSVSISISRFEERQNSGKHKAISLLETKTTQAENSLKELVNNCVVAGRITASSNLGQFLRRKGRLDSGANGPLPIPALIDANPSRSVSIGNINGNTYAFWRNQARSSTGTTWAAVRREMLQVYNDCTKGVMGNPDLILADQIGWETYFSGLEGKERYVIDDKKTIDTLGGADALKFRGAVMVWDEVVPDVETTAEVVDAIGTVSASNYHFINSQAMEIIVDSGTDFITTPMVRPDNADARTGQILLMMTMGVNNRRKHGVLYGVSQSITA